MKYMFIYSTEWPYIFVIKLERERERERFFIHGCRFFPILLGNCGVTGMDAPSMDCARRRQNAIEKILKLRVKHFFSPWVLENLFFSLWISICITDYTSVLRNDRISTSINFYVQKLTDLIGWHVELYKKIKIKNL
jgi:hypothetical protein